jgi:hypothetical protein
MNSMTLEEIQPYLEMIETIASQNQEIMVTTLVSDRIGYASKASIKSLLNQVTRMNMFMNMIATWMTKTKKMKKMKMRKTTKIEMMKTELMRNEKTYKTNNVKRMATSFFLSKSLVYKI